MKVFTVHMPPDLAGDDAAELAAFVKDGFCWPALFIPVLWLLWHRLWLVLLAYLVAVLALSSVQVIAGEGAATIIVIAFAFYFAAEANNLRRWSLARHGWTAAGEAFGRGRDEAEFRYFSDRERRDDRDTSSISAEAAKTIWPPATAAAAADADPEAAGIVGLFPEKD